jgi:6-pyruvoyl-tetrahydropterin synthase
MESVDIDNSNDELLNYIKYYVEIKLSEYNLEYGVDMTYNLRDTTILHTYKTIRKKYLNDTKFHLKKERITKLVIENYISKIYLENQN